MLVPSLYQFFRRHIQQGFRERGLAEPATVDYVSDMLARFTDTAALYAIRDDRGVPLEHIAKLLVEARRTEGDDDSRPNPSRHAFILRHVGEYTLFMSGLFRERVQARGQLSYYMDHGRSAYSQTANFEVNPRRAQVFRNLYSNFERVSGALDYIRRVKFPMNAAASDTPLAPLWRL